ncbi:enoyl-CoA hydratase/isomerase family protein [Sneathiella sp.]|uniref:enoyl-CoA hydratase/isomerase family protein n=1 Tax=Sneathiella sp. TaxID=1964365 RepID=UPI002639B015|nr:enoyl-CoA hydratase/isomerase family protein [Sneathiella sp.]MDF2367094.1 enoyl-CoA hydratase/isomerase family protein [Sneathiella sp.]
MSKLFVDILKVEMRGKYTKTLFLNRPDKANAMNSELVRRLTEEIVKCYSDQTKLLIIRGEGKHFCSGFDRDPEAFKSAASRGLLGVEIESMLQILAGAPCVTLAHIHGAAVGGGADMVVACDYRCATADASMAFPGFNLIGVSLGNSRLSQRIGPDQAMKLILQARRVGAHEAFKLGMVTNVIEMDAIEKFTAELEVVLEETPKEAVTSLKQSVRQVANRAFGSDIFTEHALSASS